MNHKLQALAALGLAGAFMGGLAVANVALNGFEREPAAIEARLIGMCDGRLMAALEESSFPAGCEWIEPIRFEPEAMAADDYWRELEAAAILRRGLVNPMTGESSR